MNIEQIQVMDTQNADTNNSGNSNEVAVANNSSLTPGGAQSLSFKLEMPNNKSFINFLNLGLDDLQNIEQSDDPIQTISLGSMEKINPKFIKNLQQFASKNQIPLRIKDINDVRLLVYSQNLFKNEKESSLKINKIEEKDIEFLKKYADNPNIVINSVNPQTMIINYSEYKNIKENTSTGEVSYKSLNVSKSLASLIDYAYKAQKPVRLDFEGNSSVILKVDTEGKLTAEFISSDKAMESLLKNSIPQLRNKMDSEGIPYKDISYKDHSNKNNKDNNQEDKYDE